MLLKLPPEILHRVVDCLSFPDLWYLATASHSCRTLCQNVIWHKYRIELARPRLNQFSHLVHAAVAYLSRHGPCAAEDGLGHGTLQSVANRLAVEMYDRAPIKNWQPSLEFLLDRTLGILIDHIVLDLEFGPTQPSTDHKPTRMSQLVTHFLLALRPTLATLFESEADGIHRRSLFNSLNHQLDTLTNRYRLLLRYRCHKRRDQASFRLEQTIRRTLLGLVRFLGILAQTDLLPASDIHTITDQRIVTFFRAQLIHSTADAVWLQEIDFQMTILLDLMRAVVHRQASHDTPAADELQTVAAVLNKTATDLTTSVV